MAAFLPSFETPALLFFVEVLVGGLLSGLMYSLVALGFVLIYKASGVFNFAQGAMVFFAVLSFVGFQELGLPFWAALPVTIGLMILVGMATERMVLRPLVNQNENTLLMATIGLAFVIEGLAQLAWGVDVRRIELGIKDEPIMWLADRTGIFVSQLDIVAGVVAGVMVIVLSILFSATKAGRGLRAVADDPAAALSVGIPLKQIWMLVWATAGVVALVAGMLWGARSGVQFALVLLALKAMPVLIIGGFTSVPGVIVAGLIVGATEKLAEVYIGPAFGGGIEGWAPYMLAVFFLFIRPEGLFGEKIIRRV
ncbi:MAG: branched-chain amino acid ABC transporter permease [Hyphomicrobiales bacterium]|nr:branched-chain amino acid ABC transporter permease [Hyphomicrobiales bacterium]